MQRPFPTRQRHCNVHCNRSQLPVLAQIAEAPIAKLVMLGNHDAWTCLTRPHPAKQWLRPLTKGPARRVMQQIDALGDASLAWNCKAIDGKPLSVVGTRPFSKARHRGVAAHPPAASVSASKHPATWLRLLSPEPHLLYAA